MKTIATSLSALLFILSYAAQSATVITFDRVEAGSNNSFGSSTTTSGMLAVGANNTVSKAGAAALGLYNTVNSGHSLAVGYFNTLQTSSFWGAANSVAIGSGNSVEGSASVVIGQSNTISSDSDFGGGQCSLISGSYNYSMGQNSIVAGTNNSIPYISYPESIEFPKAVALFGTGLIGRDDDCTVVGKNNSSTNPPSLTSAPLFVVGNGASATSRSNAFEVRANGDIIITKPQSDISMGIYD